MARYAPGKANREKIIANAKRLFWDSGFAATSLQEIAKQSDIRQSLLFYYFKDKLDLGERIFSEYSEKHDSLMCREIERKKIKTGRTIERSVFVASYYRLSLDNLPLARFQSEINDGSIQMKSSFIRDRYRMITEDNPEALEKSTIELIMLENLGLNTLLFHSYAGGALETGKEDLIRFKVRTLLRSLYIPEEKLGGMIEEIMDIESQLKFQVTAPFEVEAVG